MRAPKLDTEIRREQIVQASLDLIGSEGIEALSIGGVADRVGIVPSGIYRHFGSKDDLLNATLDFIGRKLMENISQACSKTADPLERLHALLMREIGLFAKNRAIPHVIFSGGIFTGSDTRRKKVRAIVTGYFREVEKIVREGQQVGRFRRDVTPLTIALMFKGMILPAIVLQRVTEGSVELVRHAEEAWELFCYAVSPRCQGPRKGQKTRAVRSRQGHLEEVE